MIPLGMFVCYATDKTRKEDPIHIEILTKSGTAEQSMPLSTEEALDIAIRLIVEVNRRNQMEE